MAVTIREKELLDIWRSKSRSTRRSGARNVRTGTKVVWEGDGG